MKNFTKFIVFSFSRSAFQLLMVFALATVCTVQLAAQNPKISIQGTLKTATGASVPDGSQAVTFRLYPQESGGTHVWEEAATVDVIGGIYSHYLGSVTALNTSNFATTLYLGVRIGSFELTPRSELSYAPYALSVAFAQKVVCSGAVGDVKYSILSPTQFAAENGACWVPMDGRALATTDKLRIITGRTTVPNGGGFFLRAQEFSNTDQDPDRTDTSPIAQEQGDTFRSHYHTGTTYKDGEHQHTLQGTATADNDDNDGPGNYVGSRSDGSVSGTRDITSSGSAHTHYFDTDFSGSNETRPKNLNFWIYIRIN